MRVIGLLVLAGVLGGCTSVKVLQRDGCWIRETKRTLGGTKQEVGPCVRAQPEWADDRLTRIVQECVAQVEHRWQVRAVAAWNRGEPLPPQEAEESVVALCMSQAATGAVAQTERLSERLADVTDDRAQIARDREALRAESAQTVEHLRASNDKVAGYLGEAAKRPPPVATATATATSDGTAVTESGFQAETGSASQALPPLPATALPVLPAAATAEPAAPAGPGTPAPQEVRPAPEPTSAPRPTAQPTAPPKKIAPKNARARATPRVRPARAAACEAPTATPCEAPLGDAMADEAVPAAGAAPPAPEK
jgi:hypothetical protein